MAMTTNDDQTDREYLPLRYNDGVAVRHVCEETLRRSMGNVYFSIDARGSYRVECCPRCGKEINHAEWTWEPSLGSADD